MNSPIPIHPDDDRPTRELLERLLAQARAAAPPPPKTVEDLCAAYLADAEPRVKRQTLEGYRWYLAEFTRRFGTVRADQLDPARLEADARRTTWSNSTRNNYLSTAAAALRWAGVKLPRPLNKPPKESAGAATVIPDAVFRQMLQHCQGDWHAIISFLWHTGCRPSEAARIEARMVDWDAAVARLAEHKTRMRTKRDRIVYLGPPALEVLQWQAERHKSGLLFRSHRGGPFSAQAFTMKFQRISARIGHKVTSYGLRHTFATRALARGESDTIVAHLLGHAGTDMIHRHYSHLSAHGRELRDAAERIAKAG
jgi:integrase